jgi:lipopolysaccharide transport system permease protein
LRPDDIWLHTLGSMIEEGVSEAVLAELDRRQVNGWRAHVATLTRYRFLIRNLVIRDLKVRYKNSALGILWSLLNPLLMMVVFSLVFTVFTEQKIRQYPVFFLVGLVPWNFFSGALMAGTLSVASNVSLVKKVYFPREILPVGAILAFLVNFLIAFGILIIFLFGSGLGLTIHALWVPVILATQVIFTVGLSLLLSALHVFYRDVVMILDVALLAGFFLTPIFYPLSLYGESRTIAGLTFVPAQVMRWLNPMASIVDAYRTVLWGISNEVGPASMAPDFLLRTFVTAIATFVIGYIAFRRVEHLFGEKL